jgi:hypothetical protein
VSEISGAGGFSDRWYFLAEMSTPVGKPFGGRTACIGIGVEMNDEVAKKAQIPGTPWLEANT